MSMDCSPALAEVDGPDTTSNLLFVGALGETGGSVYRIDIEIERTFA
jgi:hypothetical protein